MGVHRGLREDARLRWDVEELVRFVNSFIRAPELSRSRRIRAGVSARVCSTLSVVVLLPDLRRGLEPGRVAWHDLALGPLEERHVCCFDLHGVSCLS